MSARQPSPDSTEAVKRWLPPSIHRDKAIETIASGRAHLEARGHGRPPLLVYEDGGTMELPQYRWDGHKAVAAEGSELARSTTRYLDVCGSIDEFKRLVAEDPKEAARHPEPLSGLLDDALYMIARMDVRVREYHDFKLRVREQIDRMDGLVGPNTEVASSSAEAAKEMLKRAGDGQPYTTEEVFKLVEAVRTVAQELEHALYPLRDCCIEIEALCEAIRGARQWTKKPD